MKLATHKDLTAFCREHEIEFIDLRYADMPGRWRHITLPAPQFKESDAKNGFRVDAQMASAFPSSLTSDLERHSSLLLLPDPTTCVVDPLCQHATLALICDLRTSDGEDHSFDPRGVARRASAHLCKVDGAQGLTFAPQLEFFIFDQVCYEQGLNHARYRVDSREGAWRRGQDEPDNVGYQLPPRGGLHALPPADSLHNLRCEIVQLLEQSGIPVASHHRGPATGGHAAIRLRPSPLLEAADHLLLAKYIVRNAVARHGKTATFMPQPLFGDCGSGMPTLIGIGKDAGRREAAGGIRRRLASLLALCCPTTNSYCRLATLSASSAPGDSQHDHPLLSSVSKPAPALLFDTIDGTCNPYLALAAIALAAFESTPRKSGRSTAKRRDADAVQTRARDADATGIPQSLEAALGALQADHGWLLAGSSFDPSALKAWIRWKRSEVEAVQSRPHPHEFSLYFDL